MIKIPAHAPVGAQQVIHPSVVWWRQPWAKWGLLSFGGLVIVAVLVGGVLRVALPVKPDYTTKNYSVAEPFVAELGQTVSSADFTQVKITPAIEGEWQFERGSVLAGDVVRFIPKREFATNTTYTVENIALHRVLFSTETLAPVSFTTEAAPGIKNTGMMALKEKDAVIAPDAPLVVELERANKGLRDLQLQTNPQVAMKTSSRDDTVFSWTPVEPLPQGTAITLTIVDTKNGATLLSRTVKVADAPQLVSTSRPRYFNQGDTQVLTFNTAILAESARIKFSTEGEGSWKSPTEYSFTPKSVTPGTSYTYSIEKGMRTQQGGLLLEPAQGSFTTTGAVQVTKSSPGGVELSRASQRIQFTFDQPVDKGSVASRFSVSSGRVVGTAWNGETFIATVNDFEYQQRVTATIAPGVKNAGFGKPSEQAFSVSFTTEYRVVKHAAPFFRQQYAGSCTAASLRMILGYYGTGADDMSIVQRMGYAPRSWDTSTSPPTWDDPDQMFVGDINGKIRDGTGAGPDAGPVAKAARSYGRNASAVTGINANWVARQITDGKFVVMFGSWNASTATVSWVTPSGRTTVMNATGHATTVVGVKGDPSNPAGFWVNDPLSGGTAYWSAAAVERNISLDPYRQAVVVW